MTIRPMRGLALGALLCLVSACASDDARPGDRDPIHPQTQRPAEAVYVATLQPLNSDITGRDTTGQATLTVRGDELTIDIRVQDAPPNIEHWQHFHGFEDGRDARPARASDDKNGDGIVDLMETTPASGTTMVPFNDDPARMDVPTHDYPKADANGSYHYHKTVSLKELEAAFAKAFPGQTLDLDKRVIYLHGVASDTDLPDSVASLGDLPAHVTLPIATGKIHRQQR